MTLFAAGPAAGFPWWAFDLSFWSVIVFILMFGALLAFARKPLIEGMARRQMQILDELRRAERVRREVEQLREKHNLERVQFEREVDEMLAEGRRDAQVFSARLVERAREEAGRIGSRSQREIGLAKQRVVHELWLTTANLSAGAAERVLATDLTTDDHRRLVDAALKEIVQFPGGAA